MSYPNIFSVGEAAKVLTEEIGRDVHPREVSDLLYQREVRDIAAPIVGGRRLISSLAIPQIAEALVRRDGERGVR